MIDTHCHLTDEIYKDVPSIITNFQNNDIEKVMCVGYDLDSSYKSVELANKYACVFAIIGVHPENAKDYNNQVEEQLKELAKNKKVVGLGEIGLDYHYAGYDKDLQKQIFIKQIKLANELKLPICIHSRDANLDTLNILKEHKNYLTFGGVFHCFSESYETYLEIKKLGLKISFGGVLTFKNSKTAPFVLEKMDLNDLILETDSPYLTPEPKRGQEINEPKYIKYVYEKICSIRKIDMLNLEKIINKNVKDLYKC